VLKWPRYYGTYLLQKNIEKKEEQGIIMGRKIETTKFLAPTMNLQ
jgi:hypothetical protein